VTVNIYEVAKGSSQRILASFPATKKGVEMAETKISEFGKTFWQLSMPFVQGLSWLIADKLMRSCDEVSLFWSDSPGGQYDTLQALVVHEGEEYRVFMNRHGSIHLGGPGGGTALSPPDVWLACLTHSGRDLVLKRIFEYLGITNTKSKASYPDSIMCRVLSQSLLQVVFSDSHYRTYAELPAEPSEYTEARNDLGKFKSLVWVISKNEETIAKFNDGWMFLSGGDRIDLYSQYRSGRATIQSLAAMVHEIPQMKRGFPKNVRDFSHNPFWD
jgi:hypothetical protein